MFYVFVYEDGWEVRTQTKETVNEQVSSDMPFFGYINTLERDGYTEVFISGEVGPEWIELTSQGFQTDKMLSPAWFFGNWTEEEQVAQFVRDLGLSSFCLRTTEKLES